MKRKRNHNIVNASLSGTCLCLPSYLGRYLYSVNNLKSISGTPHLAKHVKHIVCCPDQIESDLTPAKVFYESVMTSHAYYKYKKPTPREVADYRIYRRLVAPGKELATVPLDAYHLNGSLNCLKNLESILAWPRTSGMSLIARLIVPVASPVDSHVRKKTSLLPHASFTMDDYIMTTSLHQSLGKRASGLLSLSIAVKTKRYLSGNVVEDFPIRILPDSGRDSRGAVGKANSRLKLLQIQYLSDEHDFLIEQLDKAPGKSWDHLASLTSLETLKISNNYASDVDLRPFRSVTLPHLERIELTKFGACVEDILGLLNHHFAALRTLKIVDCILLGGKLWDDVIEGLARIKFRRDMDLTIKDIWPAFGGSADMPYDRANDQAHTLSSIQEQLRHYVLRGGPWPSLDPVH